MVIGAKETRSPSSRVMTSLLGAPVGQLG